MMDCFRRTRAHVGYSWLMAAALLLLTMPAVMAPPPRRPADYQHAGATHSNQEEEDIDLNSTALGVEYLKYLEEVGKALEADHKFTLILSNATEEEIKSGAIADRLHVVDPSIRSKLDELKRIELDRLRRRATEALELDGGLDREAIKEPLHLEHRNPHTFREEDLRRLMKRTTEDLAKLDKERRSEFKKYEMEKEFKYEQELKNMDEGHKKEAQKKHEEERKKKKDHEKVHHPLSEDQLEEVWEEQDHMDKDNYDPETFFRMHDLDGNDQLDQTEVMALFKTELDKLYNSSDADPRERDEEMNEMRETTYTETDTNQDGLISLGEFLNSSLHDDYKHDQGWQGIADRDVYDEHEFEDYSHERLAEIEHDKPTSGQALHQDDQQLSLNEIRQAVGGQQHQPAPGQPAVPVQQVQRHTVPAQAPVQQVQQHTVPVQAPVQQVQQQAVPAHAPGQQVQQQAVPVHAPVQQVQQHTVPAQAPVQQVQQQAVPVQAVPVSQGEQHVVPVQQPAVPAQQAPVRLQAPIKL